MARARPSVQKRQKEARALEKRQAKAARKAARDQAREEQGEIETEEGVDPDLVGISPGPHQHRPWLDDGFEDEDED